MLLGARWLRDVSNVNSFGYQTKPTFYAGDLAVLYLQLVDLDSVPGCLGAGQGLREARRYMPAAGATLAVTLDSVDDAKRLVKAASQPFALDASVWSFTVNATDPVRGTVTVLLALSEGGVPHKAILPGGLLIKPSGG